MSFPCKAEREKCWSSRDVFWKCLDENKGKGDPETMKACAQFRAIYETSCPSQWVKHFDRKREYLKFKDRIQKDGLIPNYDEGLAAAAAGTVDDYREADNHNTSCITNPPISNSNLSSADKPQQEASSSSDSSTLDKPNSSPTTETPKCPSPNTRIYRKFPQATVSTYA